jgi:predicted transcriptional regulator
MEVIFRRGEASVAEVREEIPDAPSYSAVRGLMRVLTEKGELTHKADGPRYVYTPTTSPEEARVSALRGLLRTFFGGSTTQAMAALMDLSAEELTEEELEKLEQLVREARRAGR